MIAPPRCTHWLSTRSFDGSPHSGVFVECIALPEMQLAIVVGDVAGRGRTAALAARTLHAYIRSQLLQGTPLALLLTAANRFFAQCLREEAHPFASLFVAISDEAQASIAYGSAGHETALLFRGPSAHIHLDATGPLLGLDLGNDAVSSEMSLRIRDGDMLVVVTDGITDARPSAQRAFFGTNGVVRAVASAWAEGVDTARIIHCAAQAHALGNIDDDSSVVALRFGRPEVTVSSW
jgi:sigma-B regulation protein RsbU (phosphoserine phosphatase)